MKPETKALYPKNWPEISRMIIEKSNRICQDCKRSDRTHKVVLTTHHKDYNPANNNLINLVCLCQGCHLRRHGRDLKEATSLNQVDKLVKMGQRVFPGMEIKTPKRLARVMSGKALTRTRKSQRHALRDSELRSPLADQAGKG